MTSLFQNVIQKFLVISLLGISFFAPSALAENGPAPGKVPATSSSCPLGFGDLIRANRRSPDRIALEIKAIEDDVARLESIKMSDLFSESLTIKGGTSKGVIAKITNKEISQFKIEFDHLIDQQGKLDPDFKKEIYGFRAWLLKQPGSRGAYPELDRVEIEAYRRDGRTLSDFVSDKYVEYQKSNKTTEGFVQWAKGLGARSFRHNIKSMVASTFIRSKGFIGTFLGTTAALSMNSYLNSGLIDPIKKYFGLDKDSFEQNVSEITDMLKRLFDSFEGGKEKYNETLAKVEALAITTGKADLAAMTRDNARSYLTSREADLRLELSKFSKSLDIADKDRHTRQRDFLKSLIPGMQISEANYNTQRSEIRALEDAIKNRGTPVTAQEQSDIVDMKESMIESEKDLARALAMWQAYKFTLGPNDAEKIRDLDVQYNPIFLNYMRFKDLSTYRNELVVLVQETATKLKEYNK